MGCARLCTETSRWVGVSEELATATATTATTASAAAAVAAAAQ
jgi:hypothetical protein